MPNHNFFLKFLFITAALGFLSVKSEALYYRSVQSGNWNATSTWESGPPWSPAAATPTSADQTVTIQSGHWVLIVAGLTMDEVVIDAGGTLSAKTNFTVTINNGAGVDLTINGTFVDSLYGSSSINFAAGARWKISPTTGSQTTTQASSIFRQQPTG